MPSAWSASEADALRAELELRHAQIHLARACQRGSRLADEAVLQLCPTRRNGPRRGHEEHGEFRPGCRAVPRPASLRLGVAEGGQLVIVGVVTAVPASVVKLPSEVALLSTARPRWHRG